MHIIKLLKLLLLKLEIYLYFRILLEQINDFPPNLNMYF